MDNNTLKYKPEIAVRNYGLACGLLLVVFFVLKLFGNPTELILLKLAVVPLFFLSFGGLRYLYREPIFEHKLTLRAFEYSVLEGLVFSLFLFAMLWNSQRTATELLVLFGVCLLAFTMIKLVMLALIIRKISGQRDSIYPS